MYVLLIVVCPFVLFLLAIMLSDLLRYTDSDYPFGIFKLFLYVIYVIHFYKLVLVMGIAQILQTWCQTPINKPNQLHVIRMCILISAYVRIAKPFIMDLSLPEHVLSLIFMWFRVDLTIVLLLGLHLSFYCCLFLYPVLPFTPRYLKTPILKGKVNTTLSEHFQHPI
jgi:hypothetical protein